MLNERCYRAVSIQHTEETRNSVNTEKSVSICHSKQTSYTNNNYADLHTLSDHYVGSKFDSSSVLPALWDKAETSAFISPASLTVSFKINHHLWIINTAFSVRFMIIKSLFVYFHWWLLCFPFLHLVIQLWRKMKLQIIFKFWLELISQFLRFLYFKISSWIGIRIKGYSAMGFHMQRTSLGLHSAPAVENLKVGTLKPRKKGIGCKAQFLMRIT